MHVLYLKTYAKRPTVSPLITLTTYDAMFSDNEDSNAGLLACLQSLHAGDTLYVEREAVLAESLPEVISILHSLAEQGVDVWLNRKKQLLRSADSPYLKLEAKHGVALLDFKSDVQKIRAKDGLAKAKREGQAFGRKKQALPQNFEEVRQAFLNKKITGPEAARQCQMSVSSFYRRCKEGQV